MAKREVDGSLPRLERMIREAVRAGHRTRGAITGEVLKRAGLSFVACDIGPALRRLKRRGVLVFAMRGWTFAP